MENYIFENNECKTIIYLDQYCEHIISPYTVAAAAATAAICLIIPKHFNVQSIFGMQKIKGPHIG